MRPATCVTGIGSSSDSPGASSCAAAIVSASTRSDWCVCTTPFGSEVVPDVQRITAAVVDVDGGAGGTSAPSAGSGASLAHHDDVAVDSRSPRTSAT